MRRGDVGAVQRRASALLTLPSPLHEYQWEGVAFLCRNRAALLADEMGLGKTVQTAVALALMLSSGEGLRRALVVCPASLTSNWKSEMETWAPSLTVRRLAGDARNREALYLLPVPVLVGSYEQVRQDALDRIPTTCFDVVILDEAQRIKNRHSRTALACRLLAPKRSWALSATPLENSTDDIRAILRFLEPTNTEHMAEDELEEKLDELMLRRRKREVRAELPPVIVQDLRLTLTQAQRQCYDEVWEGRGRQWTRASELRSTSVQLLAMITKLKILCNFVRHEETSAKLDALNRVCGGAGSDARILVFSQFVNTIEWVAERTRWPVDVVTGAMNEGERMRAMQRFRDGITPRMLLVSLRAGGVGLNLGEATHVVLFDRWWNPAVEKQAIYRAHRFDREEPLHVVRFLVADTIEERIEQILVEKEQLFGEMVDGRSVTRTGFSEDELMRILDLGRFQIDNL